MASIDHALEQSPINIAFCAMRVDRYIVWQTKATFFIRYYRRENGKLVLKSEGCGASVTRAAKNMVPGALAHYYLELDIWESAPDNEEFAQERVVNMADPLYVDSALNAYVLENLDLAPDDLWEARWRPFDRPRLTLRLSLNHGHWKIVVIIDGQELATEIIEGSLVKSLPGVLGSAKARLPCWKRLAATCFPFLYKPL
ncbi:MAG TPA: hypothetical protein VNG90_00880 [Candidatus Acidoferrum sp.]|nr:hypothetical protein [Candidatus Acidoferrum sp.]